VQAGGEFLCVALVPHPLFTCYFLEIAVLKNSSNQKTTKKIGK